MPRGNNMFQRRHLDVIAAAVADLPGVTPFQRNSIATTIAYRLRAARSPGVNIERFIRAACPDATRLAPLLTEAPPPAVVTESCGYCGVPATHVHPGGTGPGSEMYTCRGHAMGCCTPIGGQS